MLPSVTRLFAMSAPLRGLLLPERVALGVPAESREGILAHAARLLAGGDEHALRQVNARLKNREALGSTALGHGCAIPHARLDTLAQPVAGFLRPRSPVPFDAPDGVDVSEFFVLLVPKQADETHLAILAAVAEKLADSRFRLALAACVTSPEVVALFEL